MKKTALILFLLLLASISYADVVDPSFSISLTYEGKEITQPFYATMLYQNTDCKIADYKTVSLENINSEFNLAESIGVDDFSGRDDWKEKLKEHLIIEDSETCWLPLRYFLVEDCSESRCNFFHLPLPPNTFRFFVYLPEEKKTFISGVTETRRVNSSYKADLKANGAIEMKDTTGLLSEEFLIIHFILAFLITLGLEALVVIVYLSIKKITIKDRIIVTVVVANLISLLIVWFVFPLIQGIINIPGITISIWILLAEVFAVLFEGFFIDYFNKDFGKKNAFVMSLIMNLVSFLIGGFAALIVVWNITK
ncbi:MAG: hypothetical protein ABH986_05840 [archaeon]